MKALMTKNGISFKIILGVFVLYVAYFLFYVPSTEHKFVERVGNAFNVEKADTILLSAVTDFEWDAVCYVAPYSTKSFNFIEDDYQSVMGDYLPAVPWPLNYGAYYFIKDKKLVEKYSFSTWGLRYSKSSFSPVALTAFIGNEPYLFMGEHNSKNDSCIKRADAAFVRQRLPQWKEQRIFITNIQKEPK